MYGDIMLCIGMATVHSRIQDLRVSKFDNVFSVDEEEERIQNIKSRPSSALQQMDFRWWVDDCPFLTLFGIGEHYFHWY